MKRLQIIPPLLFAFSMIALLATVSPAQAITIGPDGFGPGGEAGQADYDGDGDSDYPITLFGIETSVGDILQLDAFLYLDSDGDGTPEDLNGGFDGVTAQLSIDPVPPNIDYGFGYTLPDVSNLFLTYTFTNNTGSILSDLRFFSYLDAEIDEPLNTAFNEFGVTVGTLGSGSGDGDPDNWEMDDPYGDILAFNLYEGLLDNTNSVSTANPDPPFMCCDVAMALGFYLGALNPLDVATITMLISADGTYLGNYALRHFDSDPDSANNYITFSGQSSVSGPSPVPEPGTWLLMGTGIMSLAALRFRLRRKVR